jgi:cyclase
MNAPVGMGKFANIVAAAILASGLGAVPVLAAEALEEQGRLMEIVPGHYIYNAGFQNAGVIETDEGVIVIDGLASPERGRHVRELIRQELGKEVIYLINSTFHNNFTRGNAAYTDVVSIGHELYREDIIALFEEDMVPEAERIARLPDLTYSGDSMTLFIGGKEIRIIHNGPAHTRGDSIIHVPEDRIVYVSELIFYDRFPWMNSGYVAWIDAIDRVLAMDADIFVPGQAGADMFEKGFPGNSRQAMEDMKQILVAARDEVQAAIARGETEDQAFQSVKLEQYAGFNGYESQLETVIRRTYRVLQGTLE